MELKDIRITSDNSSNLNKAIIKQIRPMPSVCSLKYENGAKFFSKADIRDAFLPIELDESNKDLTIFSTPWGLYRYKRLNMGLCEASELFQEKMTRNLQGLKHVKVAMDDILVSGKRQEEHDEALNLTVGEDKCEFNKEEITGNSNYWLCYLDLECEKLWNFNVLDKISSELVSMVCA